MALTSIPTLGTTVWTTATLVSTLAALTCLVFGILAIKNYRKQAAWRKKTGVN